jgi:hypothetical protein
VNKCKRELVATINRSTTARTAVQKNLKVAMMQSSEFICAVLDGSATADELTAEQELMEQLYRQIDQFDLRDSTTQQSFLQRLAECIAATAGSTDHICNTQAL